MQEGKVFQEKLTEKRLALPHLAVLFRHSTDSCLELNERESGIASPV